MSKLQNQINNLEVKISLESEFIKKQEVLFSKHHITSTILPYAAFLGLVGGYFFARRKKLTELVLEVPQLFFKFNKLYRKFNLFFLG